MMRYLPVLSLATLSWALPTARPHTPLAPRASSADKSVIIQLFEWSWDSIAAECTNFIGPAGYGYVQVSPPQEHVTGDAWWTDYQPVSYQIISKRGDRSQFANMVETCHSAGVLVIADTLFNHMAGYSSGKGVAGSTFTHYDYPGIYDTDDFHHCGLEANDNIVSYSRLTEVQNCQLDNLADLATESDKVRSTLAAYANDLVGLGVDGFRLDASKHIPTADISAVLKQVNGTPYVTQEVIAGSASPGSPDDYVQNGDVQEFRYTSKVMEAFSSGTISGLKSFDNLGFVNSSSANVFVANHDTERTGNSLNYKSSSNTYVTATIFSLAHPYGRPTILSSYNFTSKDDGSPNKGNGTCSGTGGADGWLCQHRWIAFSGMVGFRNAVGDEKLTDWVSPQGSQIAFSRGSAGFVAINNADSAWSGTFKTSVADGSYCDVISGGNNNGTCGGNTVNVTGGSFSATVPARSALAIHTGAASDA